MTRQGIQKILSGRFTLAKVIYLETKYLLTPCGKEFKALKNKHKGEKCFVIGTGPSLTIEDLELIQRYEGVCIAVNEIVGLLGMTSWRPDYFFMSDFDGSKMFSVELAERTRDIPTVFYNIYYRQKYRDDAVPVKLNVVNNVLKNSKSRFLRDRAYGCKFSRHSNVSIYDGSTCILAVLQLAYYMGFSEVYLLGIDLGMKEDLMHAYAIHDEYVRETIGEVCYSNSAFDECINDFESLAIDMMRKNISMEIYNATRGGRLEAFPRVRLEDVF